MMPLTREYVGKSFLRVCAAGEIFKTLPAGAMRDFEILARVESYPSRAVLFGEKQMSSYVFVLLEGQVKLCMDSADGRRLALRIAMPGEFLGLTSALCGRPYEMTAEAQYLTKAAAMRSGDFHAFLMRHPAAYAGVALELSKDYGRACERLRTVGLAWTAPVKLARLLLEWCPGGQTNGRGARLHVPFTHGEIGEFIGASRETVSRTFKDLKDRLLVDQHGPILTIRDCVALGRYARTQAARNEPKPQGCSEPRLLPPALREGWESYAIRDEAARLRPRKRVQSPARGLAAIKSRLIS